MADMKQGTLPLVRRKEQSSAAHHGSVLLSVTQLMAMAMCAFVMGALVSITVRFSNTRHHHAGLELDTRMNVKESASTHQLFNNLRHPDESDVIRGPKIAWRKCTTSDGNARVFSWRVL